MSVTEVTPGTFDAEVLAADLPVLVEYWAPWCGPCRQLAPIVSEIAAELRDRLKVVKVDADANPSILAAHRVLSLPTLALYDNGALTTTIEGAKPKKAILSAIQDALP